MPMLVGDRVYTVGVTSKFHCLDKKTGQALWSHDLYKEFKGRVKVYGYSCQPLAYKNMVILMVGGAEHALMAFNQKNGSVVWQKHYFFNCNSSPILINVDGQDQVVALMFQDIIGVDPISGELLWSHPHYTGYGLAISMPVRGEDNLLFLSSSYGGGGRVLHLSQTGGKTKVEQVWYGSRIRIHFGSILRIGDYIYGSSGHDGPTPLTAVEVKTGKVAW